MTDIFETIMPDEIEDFWSGAGWYQIVSVAKHDDCPFDIWKRYVTSLENFRHILDKQDIVDVHIIEQKDMQSSFEAGQYYLHCSPDDGFLVLECTGVSGGVARFIDHLHMKHRKRIYLRNPLGLVRNPEDEDFDYYEQCRPFWSDWYEILSYETVDPDIARAMFE